MEPSGTVSFGNWVVREPGCLGIRLSGTGSFQNRGIPNRGKFFFKNQGTNLLQSLNGMRTLLSLKYYKPNQGIRKRSVREPGHSGTKAFRSWVIFFLQKIRAFRNGAFRNHGIKNQGKICLKKSGHLGMERTGPRAFGIRIIVFFSKKSGH